MASLLIFKSNCFSPTVSLDLPTTPSRAYIRPSHVPLYQGIGFSHSKAKAKARGLTVVTRAGPSTSSYVLAFVLPLSLLAITVFASIRVSDRLDEKFLEELILNEAMREGGEGEDENEQDDGGEIFVEKLKEPVLPRTRNRPKREA